MYPTNTIQRREIAIAIILTIVTCGIYGYYWLYHMAADLNTLSGRQDDTAPGLVVVLSIVTCGIYLWYWMYKAGDKLDQIAMMHGMPPGNKGLTYLLLSIFGLMIVSVALIQSELNKYADGGMGGNYGGGYPSGNYGGYNYNSGNAQRGYPGNAQGYPGNAQNYPGGSPYPGNAPGYPGSNAPGGYPGANYPGGGNPDNPGGKQPY